MNLLNYIFTNTLTIRGWIRRCAVALFSLSIVGIIVGALTANYWLDNDRVTSLLNTAQVTAQIDKVGGLLTGNQYITISAGSGFDTNKSGVWYSENNVVVEVDLERSCEDWFTDSSKKGGLITNTSLCIRDTSKQQVVTWAQIMSGASGSGDDGIDPELASLITRYPSLGGFMSGGVVNITADTLQAVKSDINNLRQDPAVISKITDLLGSSVWFMLVPMLFISVFAVIIATIALFIGLVIYTLITWAIAGIMSYDVSFEHAFSISWLPWMMVKVGGTIAGLDWYVRVLIWVVVVMIMIYQYRSNKTL